MEKEKIKMSDVREIAIDATTIPLYRAMGFKVDSRISRLAAEALSLINYNIGDELKDIEPEFNEKLDNIRVSIFKDINMEEADETTKKSLIKRFNYEISKNEELAEITKKLDKIWSKEIDNELEVIDIEEKDYSEKFKDEHKIVTVLNREYSRDGYSSLLNMVTKKHIRVV